MHLMVQQSRQITKTMQFDFSKRCYKGVMHEDILSVERQLIAVSSQQQVLDDILVFLKA